MSINHEKIQEELLDVCYGEKHMTEDIKSHLDTCRECAEYWKDLGLLKNKMSALDREIEIDERIIGGAFRKSSILIERNKNLRDLVVYVIISSMILGVLGLLVYMGYGKSIIRAQIILMVCVPLLVPFIIRQRLVKEEC